MPSSQLREAGLRLERVHASPHFKDGVFHNSQPVAPGLKPGTTLSTMSEFFLGGQRRTPPGPLPAMNPLEVWTRPVETGLRATWLGHSTVLLEVDGYRVLTDPVWGERASPMSFAGPKRFQPVPVGIGALPPLDAVVISHDHYDHLDAGSIVELNRLGVPFFCPLGVGAHLTAWGVPPERITELDWWESAGLRGLTLTAAPSQHFSGRGIAGRNRTLWSSFVIRGPRHAVFFSGDTGLTPDYADIRARLGPFDLVMLEVGAFHPAWGDIHLGPVNAVEAWKLLGGGAFLPVHWGTFNLAIHAWDEPAETLFSLAPQQSAPLLMPILGAPVEPSRVDRIDPWWRSVAALEKRRAPELAPPAEAAEPVRLDEPID